MKQSWVIIMSSSGSGLGFGIGSSVLVFMVGKDFLDSCFKRTFVVAGQSGRCLERRISVFPGQVAR